MWILTKTEFLSAVGILFPHGLSLNCYSTISVSMHILFLSSNTMAVLSHLLHFRRSWLWKSECCAIPYIYFCSVASEKKIKNLLVSLSLFGFCEGKKQTVVAVRHLSLATWTGSVKGLHPLFPPSSTAQSRWQELRLSVSHTVGPRC